MVLVSSLTYLTGILTMIGSTVLVTAATTSLGPLILHSHGRLLPPLPVVDVLPIADGNTQENVTQEIPVQKSEEQPSLAKESFDYMLAELMAVISLPANLVKFWYSAMDQLNSGKLPSRTNNIQDQSLLCSNGPCLPTANSNCQNVTNSKGLESWEMCSECQSCQDQWNRKLHHGLHYNMDSPMSRRYDVCQNRVPDCAVKCCCSSGTSWTLTDTLSVNVIPDVPVGFNTGHQIPIFVT